MRQKIKWTDKPLTEEERVFAEENHYVLFKFMTSYKLDYSEWYDILVLPYLNPVKKYHRLIELQKFDFGAIAYKTLGSALTNHFRNENRMCRKPEGGFVYIDSLTKYDNSLPPGDKLGYWIDQKQQVEKQVIEKETLVLILRNLDEMQKQIFTMLLEGYTKCLIREAVDISYKKLNRQIEHIQKITYAILSR